jgi:hypothetical protein
MAVVKTSGPSTSAKPTELTPDPNQEPSSDSQESEKGSIHGLDYWQEQDNSSSEYEALLGSNHDSSSGDKPDSESSLENDQPDDIRLPSGNSTDSFLDNSSTIFSVDDELQQDLYGEFDVGNDASDEDSSLSDEEETI